MVATSSSSPQPVSTPATTDTKTSMTSTTALMEMNETEYEAALWAAHRKAKTLARQNEYSDDVLIAKLAVLAIRQLHASDIYPRTALRAMVHMEFDEENRSTGGAIARARRDVRNEMRARRSEMQAAGNAKGNENRKAVTEENKA